MKKVKPPGASTSIRLKHKLKAMMGKLKQPAVQHNPKCTTLYNDFLILDVILNNIPEKAIRELSSQLSILEKCIEEECEKEGKRKQQSPNKQNENLSLSGVIRVLEGVESEDALLQDFLSCSGVNEVRSC